MAARNLRLAIDSDLRQVAEVGDRVRDFCSGIHLSKMESFDIELCVVEAVNNAILHAYNNRSGHSVEVVIRLLPGRLVLQVSDRGKPLEKTPAAELEPPDSAVPSEGGRGWYLIHRIMDDVRYASSGGKHTLTMSKRLRNGGLKQRI